MNYIQLIIRYDHIQKEVMTLFLKIFLEEKEREERRRRRKSRWGGSEHEKTFIPGMPTILPSYLNKEQEDAYLSESN